MGLPVTVYRHTDAGAPGIPTRTSEWIYVLKKCLVEGYGTKLPLGWTLEFEGTYKVAFRNNVVDGGSGSYFRFADYNGANTVGSSGYADLACAKSMSDIDTFVDKLMSRRIRFNNIGTASISVAGWTIIGTSRGFWMIQEVYWPTAGLDSVNTGSWQFCFFVGDIESYIPNDTAPFTILSGVDSPGDSTLTSTSSNLGSCSTCYMTLFGAASSLTKVQYEFALNSNDLMVTTNGGDINTIGVPASFYRPMLTSASGNSDPEYSFARGHVPGLYILNFTGNRGLTTPWMITLSNIEFRAVRGYYSPVMWIQSSGEWYA